MKIANYPSEIAAMSWIIRMYANSTCEISLLPGSDSSVRNATSPVFRLQTHLANPPEKTRTAADSDSYQASFQCLGGGMHAALLGPAFATGFAHISLPIPTDPGPIHT